MKNTNADRIMQVGKVILGKDECIRQVMTAILAGGHVLIEDIPGVGKTSMALAFAKAMSLKQNRVQFTPDVLPSDITGFSMYIKETEKFMYQPGAVMCNLFLADEINRTSAKTQSALLDGGRYRYSRWCYQESTGSLCGHCHREPHWFCRNPDASGVPAGPFYDLH